MIVRWLGAFDYRASLRESITWELTQKVRPVVAAERLRRGKSYIHHAKVGLLVANKAVVRRFTSDVWSVYRRGKLIPTRKQAPPQLARQNDWHAECFVRPLFIALVVKGKISNSAWDAVKWAARHHRLDILRLTRDRRLVKVEL